MVEKGEKAVRVPSKSFYHSNTFQVNMVLWQIEDIFFIHLADYVAIADAYVGNGSCMPTFSLRKKLASPEQLAKSIGYV